MSSPRFITDWRHQAHLIDAAGISACGRPLADIDLCSRHSPRTTCRGCCLVVEAAKYLSSATPSPVEFSPETFE